MTEDTTPMGALMKAIDSLVKQVRSLEARVAQLEGKKCACKHNTEFTAAFIQEE